MSLFRVLGCEKSAAPSWQRELVGSAKEPPEWKVNLIFTASPLPRLEPVEEDGRAGSRSLSRSTADEMSLNSRSQTNKSARSNRHRAVAEADPVVSSDLLGQSLCRPEPANEPKACRSFFPAALKSALLRQKTGHHVTHLEVASSDDPSELTHGVTSLSCMAGRRRRTRRKPTAG
jgi:hypothetical protein